MQRALGLVAYLKEHKRALILSSKQIMQYSAVFWVQILGSILHVLSQPVSSHSAVQQDYIVVLHDEQALRARNLQDTHESHKQWVSQLTKRSSSYVKDNLAVGDLRGYHGTFSQSEVEAIKNRPEVAYVETDSIERVQNYMFLQQDTPWGLSRISHLDRPTDPSDQREYIFKNASGHGTTIYILDTGVRGTHTEFQGRFRYGPNFVNSVDTDDSGHGTHVAGIAAGYSVGVSKYANIVSVKILNADQTGTLSNFLKALNWTLNDYVTNHDTSVHRAVINYSALGEKSSARDQAIRNIIKNGIFLSAAAGNKNSDACQYGPADIASSTSGMIIAGALNYTDIPADFTNYGSCVGVYAPGVDVMSSLDGSDTDYGLMSGTSMAAPHVAGLASYFWSLNPSYSLDDISNLIVNGNVGRVVNNLPNTVNKIAYNYGNSTVY